jgi:tetratricopeptide (TPR) repeat protein
MTDSEREWVLIDLDAKLARRQGMPLRVPIPKEEFEGLAEAGLQSDKLRVWIADFLTNSEPAKDGNWRRRNSEVVSSLEGFVDKAPLWEKAQKLFEQNDFEKALKTLRRITVMCPDDHAAKMNYASALANQGEYDKAYKYYKQIRETFADEADYHLSVAQIHVARGDAETAIETLLKALDAEPDHRSSMDALAKLGVLARVYENPRDATSLVYVRSESLLEYLTEQWDTEPRDGEFYVEQLGYHESEKRYDVALEAAERALAAGDDGNERAWQGKVACLREMGRLDDATSAARDFVANSPNSASAHIELSGCLSKAGKQQEARAEIDAALAAEPGDQMAIALAMWPDDRGDLMQVGEALPGLQSYAESHADVAGVWRSLARAKLVVGVDDEALALFEKAVGLSPDDDDLRSEWWGELASRQKYQQVIDDSVKIGDMNGRDWTLRWNEAEAYRGLGKQMEARACYMAINADESLHVDIRKKAKRTVMEMGGQAAKPAAAAAPGDAPAEG